MHCKALNYIALSATNYVNVLSDQQCNAMRYSAIHCIELLPLKCFELHLDLDLLQIIISHFPVNISFQICLQTRSYTVCEVHSHERAISMLMFMPMMNTKVVVMIIISMNIIKVMLMMLMMMLMMMTMRMMMTI